MKESQELNDILSSEQNAASEFTDPVDDTNHHEGESQEFDIEASKRELEEAMNYHLAGDFQLYPTNQKRLGLPRVVSYKSLSQKPKDDRLDKYRKKRKVRNKMARTSRRINRKK